MNTTNISISEGFSNMSISIRAMSMSMSKISKGTSRMKIYITRKCKSMSISI